MTRRFADRVEAGRALAEQLARLRGREPVILGLPRGGVPVAAQVAEALAAPLDVILVRKLGLPSQPEVAMGAIGEGGAIVWNSLVRQGMPPSDVDAVVARERAELRRRLEVWRDGQLGVDVRGRLAVVVDDGIATGATARVACEVVRQLGAQRVVLAVPVAPKDALEQFKGLVEGIVALRTPSPFVAVGRWYEDFSATSDEEVTSLLASHRRC